MIDLKQEITNYIHFAKDGLPVRKDGQEASWLFDFKGILLKKDVMSEISRIFWERHADKWPFQLCTLESGGVPILSSLINAAPADKPVNGFVIRKTRKNRGMVDDFVGVIEPDVPTIFVDDIYNSGRSASRAEAVMGRELSSVFVLVDFKKSSGRTVEHVYSLDDFKDVIDAELEKRTDAKNSPIWKMIQKENLFRPVWSRDVPSIGIQHVVPKSTPLLVDGVLYRGADNGSFSAFQANSAMLLWTHQAHATTKGKGILSSPAYYDSTIYYGAYNGYVYALDSKTGIEKWKARYCDWVGSSPELVPEKNLLLIGLEFAGYSSRGSMSALHMDTGDLVWSVPTKTWQHGSAVYDAETGLSVWGTSDNKVVAIDVDTGRTAWEFPGGEAVKSKAAISSGVVAFAGHDRHIYSLDLKTGELLGKFETGGSMFTTPTFIGQDLWCGSSDGKMYVLSGRTLELKMALDVRTKIYAQPVLTKWGVIFGTANGGVYLIDKDTYEFIDYFSVRDGVTNPIVIENDSTFYASTVMNDLHCFKRINT